jgi:3-phosphoshikimate 1-carboxyvinyltransferase
MIRLSVQEEVDHSTITLPASKSLSNRALIMATLGNFLPLLDGLSDAEDTVFLRHCLLNPEATYMHTGAGGTTFRFLLALKSILGLPGVLEGTPAFNKRPINALVDALRMMGAEIRYLEKEGYPPLEIVGFRQQNIPAAARIPAGISSQFVSALMMIGPICRGGLHIQLEGEWVSEPYVRMTAGLMAYFGVPCAIEPHSILIPEAAYMPKRYTVEADWSAAAFIMELLAIRGRGSVALPGLFEKSLQGDSRLLELAPLFGVKPIWKEGCLVFECSPIKRMPQTFDLIGEPDLAPALVVASAALGFHDRFTGLQTLTIKESDRIEAITSELSRTGCQFRTNSGSIEILRGIDSGNMLQDTPLFHTYDDHRIAMSLAPIAWQFPVIIKDPEVVHKSFPGYWEALKQLGIQVECL